MKWIFVFLILNSSIFSNKIQFQGFSYRDLSGQEGYFPTQGRTSILSFLDNNSSNAVEKWIEILPFEKVRQKNLSFINIIFPGGLFFMIPPKKAFKALQRRIEREIQSFLNHATDEQKKVFEELDIRWVADFNQSLFKKFNQTPGKPQFLLFNSQGDLIGQYTGFTEVQRLHFLWRLEME